MPEGRFVSKRIAQSEQLAQVSLEADYLFTRCLPHLDRDGRMIGQPTLVKAMTCPLRDEIRVGIIPVLLRQLAGAGLVRWFRVGDIQVLEFPGFKAHQRGARFEREAPSRFPASDCPGAEDLLRSLSGSDPDQLPLSRSRSEVEVEVEVEVASDPSPDGEVSDGAPAPQLSTELSTLGDCMQVVREQYGLDADELTHQGSMLKALHARGHSWATLLEVCTGLALLATDGALGTAPSIRLVYNHSPESGTLWERAQHRARQAPAKAPKERGGDPMAMRDLLRSRAS